MKLPKIGPAFLVTAAFIGPGTVITASLAGANYGFSLLWALLFAVVATIILQEMAARLGIVTQQGLGENIRSAFEQPVLKAISILLVVSAIVIGNGAYQSGNISGASLGLASLIEFESILGLDSTVLWPFSIGTIAFLLLWTGSYKVIEKGLIVLVALMSLAFLLTLLIAQPDFSQLASGLFIPSIPAGASLTVIALIGTTVVPYNLFLHSASASQKWQSSKQLPDARKDLFLAIPLGGLISIAIVSTAATAFFGESVTLNGVADLAPALQPVAGDMARILMASGLFAAGISSAVTAPLAAAYALSGILGLSKQLDSNQFKSIWASIIIIGVLVSSIGYRPIKIIWFAQVANGILLPVVTVFLLWLMNTERLKNHRNNWLQNVLGLAVLLVTLMLSGRSLMSAFGWL